MYHFSMPIAASLGDLLGKVTLLNVACRHCERKSQVNVLSLLERFGSDLTVAEMRRLAAPDVLGGANMRRVANAA